MKKEKIKVFMCYMFYCLIAFFLILFLNQRTIFVADDYMYHFLWEGSMPSETTKRLEGIADLPLSLWNHYKAFNGRIVSHAFVMFFMLFDKSIFDICNSIVFVLTGLLLLFHIQTDYKKWKPWHLGVVYLAMWMFFPHFGLSVLWVSGSCNYLWMSALLLLFLLPYRIYGNSYTKGKHQLLKGVLVIPLGLLAGCSNENGGGAVVLLAMFFIGYWILEKKQIPVWSVVGILSACIGAGILLLSPSSRSRMNSSSFQISIYLKRLREIIGFSYHYILLLIFIFLLLVTLMIKHKKQIEKEWYICLIVPLFYCLSGAASVVVLIASPIISGKSWIWAVCCMMIAIGQIIWEMAKEGYTIGHWKKYILFIAILCGIVRYAVVWKDISRTYYEAEQQIQMINEQKKQGVSDIVIPLLTPSENTYNAIRHTPHVDKDKEAWFNQWMALYFSVDSITGVDN